MSDERKCDLCNGPLRFQWSDTHGVGVCCRCGLPYTIFHYEGEGDARQRVEKPPSVAIRDEWMPLTRRYWEETHRRVWPASYDMGFLRDRGCSYSGATRDDLEQFDNWLNTHITDWPKPAEEETAA